MIRQFTSFAIIWLWSGLLMAQSLTKQADGQFNQLAYAKAADLYEQALRRPGSLTDAERQTAKVRLGYSYRQMRDMPNAERVYRDLIGTSNLPEQYTPVYLYYAQALASNGKYRESQEVYEKYSKLQAADKRGPSFSRLYRDVSSLTKNAGSYKVEFLKMNTKKPEFSPMRYKNGLVFVSAGHGGNGIKRVFNWNSTPFLDLYYVPEPENLRGSSTSKLGGSKPKRQRFSAMPVLRPLGSDAFTAPTANDSKTVGVFRNLTNGYEDQPVSESDRFSRSLNTKYHEGPATFSHDGSRVIFTRNNYNDGQYRQSSDGVNKLKLYTAKQTNGYWSEAEELPFNSDEYSTGHPALSKDDQLLYFASDRPGGFGGTDIYVSRWNNGKWGEPLNLGKDVNSKGNDLFPFIDEKNNLYFSSDGHPGLGELDLFYVQLSEEGTKPAQGVRNLGEPLNSPKDDFGIVTDADRRGGYFSSNRKNGGADDDLYRFTREGSLYPCRELVLGVYDAETRQPLTNTVVAIDNEKASGQKEVRTDDEGAVRLCVDADSDIKFIASHEGYLDNSIGFSTKNMSDDAPSRLEILLTKPRQGLAGGRVVTGRVTGQTDKKPIGGAKIILVNRCDSSRVEVTTDENGVYSFTTTLDCDYLIEAQKDNMGTMGTRIGKGGTGSPDLTMFRRGDVMKVENIYYDLDKADIRPDAAEELDKVATLMTKYPKMIIEMRSHTDSRATTGYNNKLSANRAKQAVTYLKSKGIAGKRMIAKGYGETNPINDCKDGVDCTEEQYQANRRTEIKVIKLD